ncbi:MAG: M3 family metallopeptidase [Pirellulaceae bacterium]
MPKENMSAFGIWTRMPAKAAQRCVDERLSIAAEYRQTRDTDRIEQLEFCERSRWRSRLDIVGRCRHPVSRVRHALHGLLSKTTYPSQSGTSVARDYVEFPSQLLEHWLDTPEVMQVLRPLSNRRADARGTGGKDSQSRNLQPGFATVEYLASGFDRHETAYIRP